MTCLSPFGGHVPLNHDYLGGFFTYLFFHPYLGKISILTSICFKWVVQLSFEVKMFRSFFDYRYYIIHAPKDAVKKFIDMAPVSLIDNYYRML